MSVSIAGCPRKAYTVEVKGWAVIHLLVYADSVADANRVAHEDRHGQNVVVMDTDYGEIGVHRRSTRRFPSEDRR